MYETSGGYKFSEEDRYDEGCIPETACSFGFDITFKAPTVEELLEKIKEFVDVNAEDLELNACGETGRVDIYVLENGNGFKASEREIEAWKKGDIPLYNTIYTWYVYKVTREPVEL